MKICIFSINAYSVFNPSSDAPIGGTEVQLAFLANFFSSQIKTSFITGDWGQRVIEEIEGIKIYRAFSLKRSFLNYLGAPFLLWRALNLADADIYLASSAGMEIGIISLFCKIKRRKFIYRTAHEWDCTGEYILKHIVAGRFFKYGLVHSDRVIAQNLEHAHLLKKNYGILVEVIKNAWMITPIELKEKNGILWVGRCERWKNPSLLLKIAEKLHQYQFIMICPKQKHNLNYFEKIKRKAKSLPNMTFIDFVPFFEIQGYFNSVALFIGTSQYEGFPNTYLQACIGSTPIVSYKVNPDNFINENNVGYCADGDLEKMIDQINRLLHDEKDWNKKSENALQYAKENHDINIVGEQWKKLLEKI